MSPNLSKAQLLNFLQCPRRFWLDQYHPEHEGDVVAMDAILDAEEAADAAGRTLHSGEHVHAINGRLGLRNAIEQTRNALATGAIILDAIFEFEGISTHIDVLDWSDGSHRAISMTAGSELLPHHISDCAIQLWIHRGLELPDHKYIVGLTANESIADQGAAERFEFVDVTDQTLKQLEVIETAVTGARNTHAALDEPSASTGAHCHAPGYPCPFLDYCEQR